MTKLNDLTFLTGLNFQHDHRSARHSDHYPKIGALIITFIVAFVGSFKSLSYFDNQAKSLASLEASKTLVQDTTQPEVLAADIVENETQIDSVEVNSENSVPTDFVTTTPSLSPTATLAPSPSQTLTPSPVPEPTYSNADIMGFIDRFAGQYNLDPNVLRHIATCESGFNQHATNGPYVGLFQFGTSAWVTGRAKMGEDANLDLRLNAEESIQTAAYLLAEGRTDLWPSCMP